ncbi:MAG TPA: phosphonoacetate hydrolase [Actinopolymorphaceae bacterium]
MTSPLRINGREYAFPTQPVVVVCIDGSEPAYHEKAMAAGRMPYVASLYEQGTHLIAECAMPSFTNPNNVSIATGVPPRAHGIPGNYFYDPEQGAEVMMNDPRFLQVPTIFAAFENAGVEVAVVTAKDKLRRLLGAGLQKGICFSAERADATTVEDNGITDVLDLVGMPLPSVYSAELSELVLAAGVRLLRERGPRLVYLSLTDYIQHKYAPGTTQADAFYAMLDRYFAELDATGAILVITADHGMNAKTTPDGKPQIVYLQEQLDDWLGPGRTRVVLPITDPYTVHHGALGSFAFLHVDADVDDATRDSIAARIAGLPGVAEVVERSEACRRFELPYERIGDFAVIADKHVVLGTSADRHDLSTLDRPLRSHGGLTEQRVPMIVNRKVTVPEGHRLRNFDAFWLALNYASPVTST